MNKKDVWKYPKKTDEELKKIAEDIYKGLIFTDRHLENISELTSVFTVFIFMKKEDINKIKNNPPGLIYEYIDKASPRMINGNPVFFSMSLLSKEDGEKVIKWYTDIKNAVERLKVETNP